MLPVLGSINNICRTFPCRHLGGSTDQHHHQISSDKQSGCYYIHLQAKQLKHLVMLASENLKILDASNKEMRANRYKSTN